MFTVVSSEDYYVLAYFCGPEIKIRCYEKLNVGMNHTSPEIILTDALPEVNEVISNLVNMGGLKSPYFVNHGDNNTLHAFDVGNAFFVIETFTDNVNVTILDHDGAFEFFNLTRYCDKKLILESLTNILTFLNSEDKVFNLNHAIPHSFIASKDGLTIGLDCRTSKVGETKTVQMHLPYSVELVTCISVIITLIKQFTTIQA